MKVKDLLKALERVDPEAEVITDVWNGRISTYTVLDNTIRVDYDVLKSDFFGTPGAFDRRLHQVESGKFFLIGSTFTNGFMIGISSESCYMNWMWKNRMMSRLRDSCICCGTLMRGNLYYNLRWVGNLCEK